VSRFRLELKWFLGFRVDRYCGRLRMAPAYDVGVKTLFDYGAGAGFQDRFARYRGRALSPLVKFGLEPLGFFRGKQA
jgi:hypothetical protein